MLSGRCFWEMLHKRHAPLNGCCQRICYFSASNGTARNLRLAARPGVGHIRLDGAVAEWLKAAVC